MLFWLQGTVLRWAVESLVQQLVVQLIVRTLGTAQLAPQVVPEGKETLTLCRECGRRLADTTRSGARNRSPSVKRRPKGLPVDVPAVQSSPVLFQKVGATGRRRAASRSVG
jgi:hypothetical protein